MPYQSPVSELTFILEHVVGFDRLAHSDYFADAGFDTAQAVLQEAAKLCDEVLAPLNRVGDQHPSYLENGAVRTPPGFAEGFAAIAEAGFLGMAAQPDNQGLGLPFSLAVAVNDMMAGACLALQLNPLMTQGQIEALEHHASDDIKALYLPKLIEGKWTGTMNLTEPQAGSDVGALTTRAEPRGDGTFAITGQKIYITWADHDFAENICHLVLARLPDAPAGTKGISLFMVPKFVPQADGSLGARNTLKVVSLEHKLGMHASPTAVMQYDGATGFMVGEPNKGMAAMFTMMNNARLGVATQGVGIAEAAYQQALNYARDRQQFGVILNHPDVRRMLGCMKADIFAARAIEMANAMAIDLAHATQDPQHIARAALMTPMAKAFCTDIGHEIAHAGIQVHGGMGIIEDTGAAQFARDVRVTSIYEGTNGIQAIDLIGRKLMFDHGAAALDFADEIITFAAAHQNDPLCAELLNAAQNLKHTIRTLLAFENNADRLAGAVPFLRGFARVAGGYYHLLAAQKDPARKALATIYIRRLLPEQISLFAHSTAGISDLSDDAVFEN